MAREKLTQMRLKKKRRLRGDRGQNNDDEADAAEQYVVTIGSGAEEEDQASDIELSEEPVQIVPKKAKSNKRVRIAEENPENEEERVLRLLGQSGF